MISTSLVLGMIPGTALISSAVDGTLFVNNISVAEASSGDGWSFDADSNTLTLENYDFTGVGMAPPTDSTVIMYYPYDTPLTIELKGTNNIVQGDGSNKTWWGIYSRSDLIFKGDGTLNASTTDGGYRGAPIYCEKNVTIDGSCTINATSGTVTNGPQGHGIGGGDKSTLTICPDATVDLNGPKGGAAGTVIYVAVSVTNGSNTTYYGSLSDALSAWTDNTTLTLLKDITTDTTINVTGTKTLDLNGYGIKKTGSGSVISVGSGADFTLTDSNPSQTHKYSIASPQSNGAGLAAVDDTNGTETFTGGYITGGSVTDYNYGGGITISGNSNVTMNGGTVIGNKGTQECGGVQIGQGSKLTMNGGAVIGNSSNSGGAGINARGILVMTGGTVAYNYASNNGCGGGIRTHSPGGNTSYAEISGGYITNNFASSRAGGIGEGKAVLSGSPVIQDNYSSSGKDNIYALVSDTYFIYINGELTNTTPIGVKLPRGAGVFTRTTNTDYNVAGNFTSDNPDYEVIKDSASNQLRLGVHSHAFTYTAEGNTITAECTGEGTCKITEGLTMTISASDATYDGAAHGAELSTDYNTTAFPGNYTIEYYMGETAVNGTPVEAGDYTAKVTVGDATASVDYKIAKAPLTITAEAKSKTYGGTDPELTYTNSDLVKGDTISGALARVAGEDAGTYRITQGTLSAGDNYNVTFNGADFTIDKAEITITADDKSTQYKSDLAELTYAVGGDYVEGDDLGVTINTDATNTSTVGEYTVTVGWNENPNYTATLTNGKYTITKADLTTSATGFDGKYDGEAHSISVDVGESDAVIYYGTEELTAENYETAGSTTNPAYTDAGEYTVYYYIATGNYDPQPVSGSKVVKIDKADPTVTPPTVKELTANGEEQALVNAGSTENGKIFYALGEKGTAPAEDAYSETIPTGKDAGTYYVWYKVLGDKNHNDTEPTSVEAEIKKADSTVKEAPTAKALTANGEEQELVNAGSAENGKIVYALGTDKDTAPAEDAYSETVPTGKDAGTYYVWYKVLGDGNHNDTEPASVEVKIAEPEKEPEKDQPGDNPKTAAAAACFGAVTLAAASVIVSKKRKK